MHMHKHAHTEHTHHMGKTYRHTSHTHGHTHTRTQTYICYLQILCGQALGEVVFHHAQGYLLVLALVLNHLDGRVVVVPLIVCAFVRQLWWGWGRGTGRN